MKKKLIALILALCCCLLCMAVCLGCGDGLRGTYKAERGTGSEKTHYFLELKAGNKCKVYTLGVEEDGKMKSKDTLVDGDNLISGTYKKDGDSFTLYMELERFDGVEVEEIYGKVLSNGNVKLDMLFGVENLTLKKQ